MSPEYQTLLTLACMVAGYFWGHHQGKLDGIGMTVDLFVQNDMLKPGTKINGVSIEDIYEEDEDE